MRGILSKELAQVLDRRGLRHREWAVEWESSALEFLLDKGFSPAMGARPLKRAIDRHLLAPLAATMVEHRFPEGDQFLFVRSDGRAIQVEFVDPDAPIEAATELEADPVVDVGPTLARMVLQPTGVNDERLALNSALRRLEDRLADSAWTSLEHALTTDMQQPAFWDRQDRFAILSRFALMDRVKAAIGTAQGLEGRLNRSTDQRPLLARFSPVWHRNSTSSNTESRTRSRRRRSKSRSSCNPFSNRPPTRRPPPAGAIVSVACIGNGPRIATCSGRRSRRPRRRQRWPLSPALVRRGCWRAKRAFTSSNTRQRKRNRHERWSA